MAQEKIFISYSSDYHDFAERVRSQLQAWGHHTWINLYDIPKGAYGPDEIDKGLAWSTIIIGVISPEAVNSRNVKKEWDWAITQGKRFIPLLFKSVESLPPRYVNLNYIDFTSGEAKGFAQLKQAVLAQGTLGKTTLADVTKSIADRTSSKLTEDTPKRSWNFTIRFISLLVVVVSALWLTTEPKFDSLVAFLVSITALIGSFVATNTHKKSNVNRVGKQLRNREALLQKVYDYWIAGVLDKNLSESGLFDIGISIAPGAVLRCRDLDDYAIANTSQDITRVFQDMNRELLILGDPGSGKTTLMLQLARQLIAIAKINIDEPIPIVFNLSSWGMGDQSFTDWLKYELHTRYQIPKKTADNWVEMEQLLLMLDGLDEVEETNRDRCVDEINKFRKIYQSVDLTVCSRITDYEALSKQLDLEGAIVLQPLTEYDVQNFISRNDLDGLRDAITHDVTLQEMVKTPFLLNAMAIAYEGMSPINLKLPPNHNDAESRRKHLFDKYVERQIKHLTQQIDYKPKDVRHYLNRMAKQLSKSSQTILYFNHDILSGKKLLFYVLCVGLLLVLLGFVPGILLVKQISPQLISSDIGSILIEFIFPFFFCCGVALTNTKYDNKALSWRFDRQGLRFVGITLGFGLFGGFTLRFLPVMDFVNTYFDLSSSFYVKKLSSNFYVQTLPWNLYGLKLPWYFDIQELLSNFVYFIYINQGKLLLVWLFFWIMLGIIEAFDLSRRDSSPFINAIGSGFNSGGMLLILCVLIDLVNQINFKTQGELEHIFAIAINTGLHTSLLIGSIIVLLLSLILARFPEINSVNVNRLDSAHNQKIISLINTSLGIGIIFGSLVALPSGILGGSENSFIVAVMFGLICILVVWSRVIKQSILAWFLYTDGFSPRNYNQFLDGVSTIGILREVGGGYIFRHRYLLEYFTHDETAT